MKKIIGSIVVLGVMSAFSQGAYAACPLPEGKKADDLSVEELKAHYECSRDELVSSYQKGGQQVALEYTKWKAGATGPAKPGGGIHSNQILMTYVNDIGYDSYVQYKAGLDFPIGTIAIKESYKIRKNGKLKKGLLLTMEKVGVEKAPKTAGWLYGGVKASGAKFKAPQKFCHNCHKNYAFQDYLGYPVDAVRLKN